MSQALHFKWRRTKEGKMHCFLSRFGRTIYLSESGARNLRDVLTEALREFKQGKEESVKKVGD